MMVQEPVLMMIMVHEPPMNKEVVMMISPSSADDDNTLRVGVGDDEDDVNAKVFKLQLIIYPRQQK